MLIYGDRSERADPAAVLRELAAELAAIAGEPPGLPRHARLVGAFVRAGELAQGLADAELAAHGDDARRPASEQAIELVSALAHATLRSWSGGFSAVVPRVAVELSAPLPDTVELRHPEGYAYYALYPEAYALAARAARRAARHVIGIRSIGTGLAAIVAAATGAPLPATVRPLGDPYRRRLAVAPALLAEWTRGGDAIATIVDEGPGRSGSSFGAAIDLLLGHGVPLDRIECFPSHAGPLGPEASPAHRERWAAVTRTVADPAWPARAVTSWLPALIGPLAMPLEDLSAGAWRARLALWPPAVTFQERVKLLARTADGATWLARFVGLGAAGALALARARALREFVPEVAGLCHGFLVERWRDDTVALDPHTIERSRLVVHLGRYLGARAQRLPARPGDGAGRDELVAMTRRNAQLALGADIAADLERWETLRPALSPVQIDGRLHAWEWRVASDGALLKTDAVDHCAGHDLIGCQDIAWDIVGATHELDLAPAEEQALATIVGEHTGRAVDPDACAFLRPAYLAFQLGRHALAADAVDPAEAARLRALVAQSYTPALRRALARPASLRWPPR